MIAAADLEQIATLGLLAMFGSVALTAPIGWGKASRLPGLSMVGCALTAAFADAIVGSGCAIAALSLWYLA